MHFINYNFTSAVVVAVVVGRWAVSADCAVVSEETGREEADEKIQVEVGIYITTLNL